MVEGSILLVEMNTNPIGKIFTLLLFESVPLMLIEKKDRYQIAPVKIIGIREI